MHPCSTTFSAPAASCIFFCVALTLANTVPDFSITFLTHVVCRFESLHLCCRQSSSTVFTVCKSKNRTQVKVKKSIGSGHQNRRGYSPSRWDAERFRMIFELACTGIPPRALSNLSIIQQHCQTTGKFGTGGLTEISSFVGLTDIVASHYLSAYVYPIVARGYELAPFFR